MQNPTHTYFLLRTAGMFYWIRSLQTYDEGWNYFDNLKAFVRGGMKDGAFIDAVSGIVNRVRVHFFVILRSANEGKTNCLLTIMCIVFWFIFLVTKGCHNPVSFSIP